MKNNIILRPLVSEKATLLEAGRNYVFEVRSSATKSEIKKAIHQIFGVKVIRVNTLNKKAKRRMWRGKAGRAKGLKKAIVTLAEGEKIEVIPK